VFTKAEKVDCEAYASQSTLFSFNSFETPAGSNFGEHYKIL